MCEYVKISKELQRVIYKDYSLMRHYDVAQVGLVCILMPPGQIMNLPKRLLLTSVGMLQAPTGHTGSICQNYCEYKYQT